MINKNLTQSDIAYIKVTLLGYLFYRKAKVRDFITKLTVGQLLLCTLAIFKIFI